MKDAQLSFFKNTTYQTQQTVCVDKLPQGRTLRVISLFSGCGGMDLGFRGDFSVFGEHFARNPYDIVFANDILPRACATYAHNFGHEVWCGDVRRLDYGRLPSADVVIGGFPCQDFSLAGKRQGLQAERGRLYQEMKNVVAHGRPKAFVAENVDGIRRGKGGAEAPALAVILEDFASLGYTVVYKALNAADFGVPQNRVRIIIVGIRNDLQKSMKYPASTCGGGADRPYRTAWEAINDLWDKLDVADIPNHTTKDYSKAAFHPGKNTQGNHQISADRPAPTIRSEHHGNIEGHYRTTNPQDPSDMSGWRRLSVRECARLQSFPDSFVFPVSASDAYKQVGNAVPPVLAWHVARALYISLTR